jgi:hypothetical protein
MRQLSFGRRFTNSQKFVEEKANPEGKATKPVKEFNQPSVLANRLTEPRKRSKSMEMEPSLTSIDFVLQISG